jgi:hypothetical protein
MAARTKVLRRLDHESGVSGPLQLQDHLRVGAAVELRQGPDQYDGSGIPVEKVCIPLRHDGPDEILLKGRTNS